MSQFDQRPMFSEPGPSQPPPETGRLSPEIQPNIVRPSDRRMGSNETEDLVKPDPIQMVHFHVIDYNVSFPPTDAQIRAAAGSSTLLGDAFVIRDGSGAAILWLIMKGGADTYHYELLTKAT